MVKRIRNKNRLPYISAEGEFTKPVPPKVLKTCHPKWYSCLTPHERLFAHHTLSSARRFIPFKTFSGLVPKDHLDFALQSPYNHSTDPLVDIVDPCMQIETYGIDTWRRLRNTKDLPPKRDTRSSEFNFYEVIEGGIDLKRYNMCHPVLIGGITERVHPSYVKLMNSSHHSPQTNAGYSRQDSDGSFFKY